MCCTRSPRVRRCCPARFGRFGARDSSPAVTQLPVETDFRRLTFLTLPLRLPWLASAPMLSSEYPVSSQPTISNWAQNSRHSMALTDGFLEPSTGVSAAPVDGVVPEMASRSNSLAAVTTHVATPTDHSIEPSAHTDWFNWLNQADGRSDRVVSEPRLQLLRRARCETGGPAGSIRRIRRSVNSKHSPSTATTAQENEPMPFNGVTWVSPGLPKHEQQAKPSNSDLSVAQTCW